MKWYAISGSWRGANEKVRRDVQKVIKDILKKGNGIITGGALGVDYFANEAALAMNQADRIKIFLPIKLNEVCEQYQRWASEGIVTPEESKKITAQLQKIYKLNRKAIFDNTRFSAANEESYYARNTAIVENCDELYAFQANGSKGTQDAIDKAKGLGKKVHVKKYTY
ncbi:MAG: hypothetical protein ABIB71_04480 [Candidatus Woesearchaeota archaeon]